jgi:hypothetical protein
MAGRQAANKAQRSPKGWQKLQRFTAEAIAAALLYLAACNQYTPVREDEAKHSPMKSWNCLTRLRRRTRVVSGKDCDRSTLEKY